MTTWLCCDLAQAVEDAIGSGTLGNLVGARSADPVDQDRALRLLRGQTPDPLVDQLITGLERSTLVDPYPLDQSTRRKASW